MSNLKAVNLRELRKRNKDLTQKALAEIVGTEQAVISKIENGIYTPSVEMAVRLVVALNAAGVSCTLEDLIVYDLKMTANSANHLEPVMG